MSFTDSSHSQAKTIPNYHDGAHHQALFDHVMCFGTFDIFHPGHAFYLSESQKFAKKMTVIIARDHRVFSGKGRDSVHDEQTRLRGVQESFPHAHVILGHESDIFAPIRDLSPDVLSFGYDQRVPESKIRELFPDIEIVRIGGYETERWKSSLLRSEQTKTQNIDEE